MTADNRRQYERTSIDLSVRFVSKADLETSGRVIDISQGGMALATDSDAEIGDSIIAYPEGLGRLTGVVRRKFEGGIAVEFDLSDKQRDYLNKRIKSAVSGVPYIRLLEYRAHKRVKLNLSSEAFETDTKSSFPCDIVDISATGSKIRSEHKPAIGAEVRIGTISGIVCRYTDDGFAIQFGDTRKTIQDCA